MYQIPEKYYFRIHHARPRFKNDIENVLLFFSHCCTSLGEMNCNVYAEKMNMEIRLYPGNDSKSDKTINNWRTEISALFGFYIEDKKKDKTITGKIARFLDKEQDLIQFFKFYLYKFQYPGGHIKPDRVEEMIKNGVKFKPVQYILKLMFESEKVIRKPLGITKEEATHCIFNDLRVTRDHRNVHETLDIILNNRKNKVGYALGGDITRYAGDVLDYMVQANLLRLQHNYYYLNHSEMQSIMVFINDNTYFKGYDAFYKRKIFTTQEISSVEKSWFEYVNEDLKSEIFQTNLAAYITDTEKSGYGIAINKKVDEILEGIGTTKDVGDLGETLVIGHEKVRLVKLGRSDLIHLIQKIPTQFAVGYDIQSVEADQRKRYIEVKTTISYRPLKYLNFHLTKNEWDSATTLKDRYFIYRLMINKTNKIIYILQNPVQMYKNDKIEMRLSDGAEISFSEKVSEKTELLIWDK